jgi:hypothetical protein
VPSTELGPAARDVCAKGFSFATTTLEEDRLVLYSSSKAATSCSDSGGDGQKDGAAKNNKRKNNSAWYNNASSGTADTAAQAETPTVAEEAVVPKVSFGNDTKRVRGAGAGAGEVEVGGGIDRVTSTGKTVVEQVQLRGYLRQGVDR